MATKKKVDEVVVAYKGFDKDLKCRGYQFEVGETYTHKGMVKVCESGFHSCLYPLDIFKYYSPSDARFAVVQVSGEIVTHGEDSKVASANLTVTAEIKLPELVNHAISWIMSNIKPDNEKSAHNDKEYSHASNTGDQSAASNTGYRSAASVSGKSSVAIATGAGSKAKACAGSAIVLCLYDDVNGVLTHIKSAIAGDGEIKPDTWYTLSASGEFIEAD